MYGQQQWYPSYLNLEPSIRAMHGHDGDCAKLPENYTEETQNIRNDSAHKLLSIITVTLQWRHNDRDGVSNRQPHDCLLNRLFRRRSKKTLKLRVTGLCVGNSSRTGEFPAQKASNAENASIRLRHHVCRDTCWLVKQSVGLTASSHREHGEVITSLHVYGNWLLIHAITSVPV